MTGVQTCALPISAYIPYNTVPIDNAEELFALKREEGHSREEGLSREQELSREEKSQNHDNGCALAIDRLCFEAEGRKILWDIHLHIKEGEHIAIMGENGSGKSTLLRCIMGMYVPTSGSITLFGKSPTYDAEYFREKGLFSYMPAASQLYETTVDENISMGSFAEVSLDKIKDATGVSDFSDREISSISQLSGGEQQRVNAARAFSNGSAKIILLDEPTASLDKEHAEQLMKYIRNSRATVIYTTHREEDAAFADKVVNLC